MKAGKMSGKSIASPDSSSPDETKTEQLEEVVVNSNLYFSFGLANLKHALAANAPS